MNLQFQLGRQRWKLAAHRTLSQSSFVNLLKSVRVIVIYKQQPKQGVQVCFTLGEKPYKLSCHAFEVAKLGSTVLWDYFFISCFQVPLV